jgi:hypothetical protein
VGRNTYQRGHVPAGSGLTFRHELNKKSVDGCFVERTREEFVSKCQTCPLLARPVLELMAFRRVTLQPKEKRTVVFDIRPADLAFYNIDINRVVESGVFTIYAGPDSVQLKSVKLLLKPAGSGLTFRHELNKKSVYGCYVERTREEFVSKCQT